MASSRLSPIALGMAAIILLPLAAPAQGAQRAPLRPMAPERAAGNVEGGKLFGCDGERQLVARFITNETGLVAVVDIGEGPMNLPLRPFEGGSPKITWSDGTRTLVWTTGVRLMFTDESRHLMCGRAAGEGHH